MPIDGIDDRALQEVGMVPPGVIEGKARTTDARMDRLSFGRQDLSSKGGVSGGSLAGDDGRHEVE